MSISPHGNTIITAQHAPDGLLPLITISHDDFISPYRFAIDTASHILSGGTFQAYPASISLPDQPSEGDPRARIVIDNVSQEVIEEIRSITTPPTITIEIASLQNPDVVDVGPIELTLHNVKYNLLTIDAELGDENLMDTPLQGDNFDPSNSPGLF